MLRLLGWCLLAAAPLLGDGGVVVLHKESSPFVITVFASPTPPRAGVIDLTVLVQASETLETVLDADVQLEFTKGGSHIQVPATRDHKTQNKLLYAASVHLNSPGEWIYTVSVRAIGDASAPVAISSIIAVAAEQPKLAAYWNYLALPFLGLAIFALHQWLRWGETRERAGNARTVKKLDTPTRIRSV